ncbi:MAG: methyltransferase [Cyclobacteriaceae bacterium]
MHRKNGSDNAFYFKQFHIHHDRCAMKVGTDGVLLGAWAAINTAQKILDVGTGTGLIALMLAQRSGENVYIDAIEVDFDAYQQAIENVNSSIWNKRITPFWTSIQHYSASAKYDLIVSNPPYFINSLKPPDQKRNLSRHADELPHSILIESCKRLLHPEGRLCLILPYSEGIIFAKMAATANLFCNKKINVRHKESKPVERLLLEFSHHHSTCQEGELILFYKDGKRTALYHELVSDFYITN